ncbi:hypothetical protein Lesp02_80430 [Lentzea sp. NBRC 105346]|uniref:DUF6345 domain-containing protein n=1 Tax=Lentzea sp. NBRC 105346 TaxID=3032205 RepID=UPI0024A18561|nr:DUF6345 domain-containing protein [Lentzea sp. NBRC 105346]GLZ35856.1 hypothetical protein Lesp02_80430 [Lentzea sp. NBRC 105346]
MTRKITTALTLSALVAGGFAGVAHAEETELPVYGVKRAGLDADQAVALQRAFGLKDVERSEAGAVSFIDDARYLHVPSIDRGEGKPEEDGSPTVQTAIDFDGLRNLRAVPTEEAAKRVAEALRGVGLLPSQATATARHSTFEVSDREGKTVVSAPLDTAVSYTFSLDGIPLVGEGAKLRVALDGDGQVTGLTHSTRELAKVGSVAVYDLTAGRARCQKAFGEGVRAGRVSYVYESPSLDARVEKLLPSFRCEGFTQDGSPAQAITVPAAVGSTLPVPGPAQPPRQSGGVQALTESGEVGSEGTGNCAGLPNTSANIDSFNGEAGDHGVPVQFSWKDANAWESDFKDPMFAGGDDSHYADDVDLTYWQGHGSGTGFYFSGCSNHNDTKLANTDARWGNLDAEWMSLFTCLILEDTNGGKTWAQRWAQAFRGLHQINSFTTVSTNSASHGGKYAHYLLRSNPMKVRVAWAQASIDTQGSDVIWASMGPVSSNGALANFDDYFHGRGPVSGDVLSGGWYWRISGVS